MLSGEQSVGEVVPLFNCHGILKISPARNGGYDVISLLRISERPQLFLQIKYKITAFTVLHQSSCSCHFDLGIHAFVKRFIASAG